MELGCQLRSIIVHNIAYRDGDELKGYIANGDIDGIQDRKRSENDIFTLSQAGRDLLLALNR